MLRTVDSERVPGRCTGYDKRSISGVLYWRSSQVVEWKSWPSVSLSDRHLLPACPGIYVVADANDCIWYVGQAINLQSRWLGRSHHRYPQLARTNRKLSHKIYWQPCLASQLNEKEQLYISLLRPELNGCKVETYLPKQPQVEREIKRVFKALNRSTLLFPGLRSLIAGEYEDENGTRCILTITNVNDLRILEKSIRKRYSAEVRRAWIGFESGCGKSETHYHCCYIAAYCFEGRRYEFIEGSEILWHLRDTSDAYNQFVATVEMLGIEVKALRDLSILSVLPLEEEYNLVTHGKKHLKGLAYLNYRRPLLTPLLEHNRRI
jgi:hypothetical protein